MALTVPCALCRGSGARGLTEIEEATLAALRVDWQTSQEVRLRLRAQGVELTPQALVMRLQSLYEFGLVERRSHNRSQYAWRAVTR